MGGNAFNRTLPDSAFPRIPPIVYAALKSRLTRKLADIFTHVDVPAEAPEKVDHGDLDISVACPSFELPGNPAEDLKTITQTVARVIGAYSTWMNGQLWDMETKKQSIDWKSGDIFYQVDVHVCSDKAELDNVVLFNSYGDLGMMLGLLAANAGLKLGSKGLKYPNRPYEPIFLSQSFDGIFDFFGLSMTKRRAGFQSKLEIFKWVGSSRLFDPLSFKSSGEGITKVKADRRMYAEFVQWANEQAVHKLENDASVARDREMKSRVREEALVRFNKKEEHDEVHRIANVKARLKEVWNGRRVGEMIEMPERWKSIKIVMDSVRSEPGWEHKLLESYDELGDEGLKRIVLAAKILLVRNFYRVL
ncbi:hypothetical protein C8J56DRAFT_1073703 [Mycena floridula]|nr:hypothetical protein C8J56DRAFT_1073703 [Mycena floridula]